MRLKKLMMISLVLTMLFFSSCSDYGYVEKAKTSEKTENRENASQEFNPLDNTFNFEFDTYENELAELRLPYPASFKKNIINDGEISFKSSEDLLSNSDFKLIINYSSELIDVTDAADLVSIFEMKLKALAYDIANSPFQEYMLSSEIIEKSPFSGKYEERIYKTISKNAKLKTLSGRTPKEDYASIKYFIFHNSEIPMVFSAITPLKELDQTEKIVDYMISNMQILTTPEKKMQKVSFSKEDKHKYLIPKDLSSKKEVSLENSTKGFSFTAPTNKGLLYSGMGFSFYQMNKKITDDMLNDDLGWQLFENNLNYETNNYIPNFYCDEPETIKQGNTTFTYFDGFVNVLQRDIHKSEFYPDASVVHLAIYLTKNNDGYQLFVLSSNFGQYNKLTEKVIKNIITNY